MVSVRLWLSWNLVARHPQGPTPPPDAEITQNTRWSQVWPEVHVSGRKNIHINILTWNNNGRLQNQKQQKEHLKWSETRSFQTPGINTLFKMSCPNPPPTQPHHLTASLLSPWNVLSDNTLSSTHFLVTSVTILTFYLCFGGKIFAKKLYLRTRKNQTLQMMMIK